MAVKVFDTYVRKPDGTIMHFDILVPEEVTDPNKVYQFGMHYLYQTKKLYVLKFDSSLCSFCHIESPNNEMLQSIETQGYHIIELEGCD